MLPSQVIRRGGVLAGAGRQREASAWGHLGQRRFLLPLQNLPGFPLSCCIFGCMGRTSLIIVVGSTTSVIPEPIIMLQPIILAQPINLSRVSHCPLPASLPHISSHTYLLARLPGLGLIRLSAPAGLHVRVLLLGLPATPLGRPARGPPNAGGSLCSPSALAPISPLLPSWLHFRW